MATVIVPAILVQTASDTDQASTQETRMLSITTGTLAGAAISQFSIVDTYEDVVS